MKASRALLEEGKHGGSAGLATRLSIQVIGLPTISTNGLQVIRNIMAVAPTPTESESCHRACSSLNIPFDLGLSLHQSSQLTRSWPFHIKVPWIWDMPLPLV